MRTHRVICLAAACGALSGALLAPGVASALSVRDARFAAVVKAQATTSWSTNHDTLPGQPCGALEKGSGTERFEFATRNPIRVRATSFNGSDPILAFGPTGRALGIPVAGSVRRHGRTTITQHEPGRPCGTGGDDLEPLVQPDCGTKRFSMTVRVNYLRGRVSLFPGSTPTKYVRCSAAGVVFPSFVTSRGTSRVLSAGLSKRAVFDRSERTFHLVGEGSQRSTVEGTTYLSTIHWEIDLKRVD